MRSLTRAENGGYLACGVRRQTNGLEKRVFCVKLRLEVLR